MPVQPIVFAGLVQTNVAARLVALGASPLTQPNPSYFIAMCTAIGMGIIQGAPSIVFTSSDTGIMGTPPIPGSGSGIGIITSPTFFAEDLYTRIRGSIISQFGSTSSVAYPPPMGNSGQYLLAFCQGINDAFNQYYPIGWTLSSTDPTLYMGSGTIGNGNFTGLIASVIQTAIVSGAPSLQGSFWPTFAQAVSESYVVLIEQHSTGTVTLTGSCAPGPSQICGLPSTGTGIGTAS